jgi:hypothetical protein
MITPKDVELGYMLKPVRATVKKGLAKPEIASLKDREFNEGKVIDLPIWAALILKEKGFVDADLPNPSLELFKAIGRERIQPIIQLSQIDKEFYTRIRTNLKLVKEGSEKEKAKIILYDLISMRLSKLMQIAVSGSEPSELKDRLSLEELSLFELIKDIVKKWKEEVAKVSR